MRGLFLLIFLVVLGYGIWQFVPAAERRKATKVIAHHGLRLGALICVVIVLALAAYYLPSSPLTF